MFNYKQAPAINLFTRITITNLKDRYRYGVDSLPGPHRTVFCLECSDGYSSNSLGDKLQNVDFSKVINGYGFLICETWSEPNTEVVCRL